MSQEAIEKWVDEWDGAPVDDEELAYSLMGVEDSEAKKIATEYINALEELRSFLDEIGFEFG